jgi:hypothetical protein
LKGKLGSKIKEREITLILLLKMLFEILDLTGDIFKWGKFRPESLGGALCVMAQVISKT